MEHVLCVLMTSEIMGTPIWAILEIMSLSSGGIWACWRSLQRFSSDTPMRHTHSQPGIIVHNCTHKYRVWTGSKFLKPSITALWQFCSLLCDISNDCVYKLYMSNVPPPSRPHTAKQIENTKHWPFCSSLTILEEDIEQDDSDFVHDGNVGV